MCGIAGLYHFASGKVADRDLVLAMRDRLTHRGPDDAGLLVDGPIGLGHRRLSIVDLSEAGRNPMPNEDASLHVVLNGEIYNVLARRAEFMARGHAMRSHTDTEMLLHLYEEKGPDLVHELRGMFAFALWDAPRRRLLVARDRVGKKPLYWRAQGGTFAFASELKALLADPAMPRAIDPAALHAYLTLQYVPSPDTILEGVRRLPPGSLLLVTADGVEERRWWSPPTGETRRLDDDAATGELRHILEEAVSLRFMSDVPLGAFLSGGIDSSLVCALMARQMERPVRTFTIGFAGAPEDETVHARAVARHIGAEHHEFVVRPDALAILPWLVWHLDEPLADASALPTWAVSEMARQHVTVVLSGDGGDETFAGYETYRLAAAYRQADRLPDPLRASAAALARSGFVAGAWARRLERLMQDPVERHLGVMSIGGGADVAALLAPDLRARLANHDPHARLRAHVAGLDPHDPQTLLHLDLSSYMTDDVLAKVDRMSMAHALEVRVPLLDTRVVEFASRLPFDLKWRHGTSKWLLKRVARDLLPPAILARGKQGFGVPIERWFGGQFESFVAATLSREAIERRGLFDAAGVARLVARATRPGSPDGRAGRLVWALLVFELWAQAFLDRPGDPPAGRRPTLLADETAVLPAGGTAGA
ncbi:MAG: asparagine synthase (glutamine-hydrolyzing) [Candidatus Eisenbacteria bacterium]